MGVQELLLASNLPFLAASAQRGPLEGPTLLGDFSQLMGMWDMDAWFLASRHCCLAVRAFPVSMLGVSLILVFPSEESGSRGAMLIRHWRVPETWAV